MSKPTCENFKNGWFVGPAIWEQFTGNECMSIMSNYLQALYCQHLIDTDVFRLFSNIQRTVVYQSKTVDEIYKLEHKCPGE